MGEKPAGRPKGVRERMRDTIRTELTQAALASVREVGFAATTASQIAAAVGVSERTFFRYFATKEDAVLQPVEDLGPSIAAALRDRPDHESPLEARRNAFDLAIEAVAQAPDAMATVMRLNRTEPALRGRHLQHQDLGVGALANDLDVRAGRAAGSAVSRLQCATMLLAWEKALVECLDADNFGRVGTELNIAIDDLRGFVA